MTRHNKPKVMEVPWRRTLCLAEVGDPTFCRAHDATGAYRTGGVYDLGFFDDETGRLEPIANPFEAKVLPMSPE